MKVKYKQFEFYISGYVYSYYIKLYKHWWDLSWTIEMDGDTPAAYDLKNGEYIRKF